MSYVLKCAPKPISSLLDPIQFGWEIVSDKFKPKGTDQLPGPTKMLELSMCACRTPCDTNGCSCRKFGFICINAGQCKNCENAGDNNEEELPRGFLSDFEGIENC